MNENYLKKLCKNRFSVIDIKNINDDDDDEVNEKMKAQGYTLAPYLIVEHTEESSNDYKDFMDDYNEKHKFCPKCFSTEHTSTLVGYILNMDKKEDYKDKNKCVCRKCGDKHIFHDRLSSNEII